MKNLTVLLAFLHLGCTTSVQPDVGRLYPDAELSDAGPMLPETDAYLPIRPDAALDAFVMPSDAGMPTPVPDGGFCGRLEHTSTRYSRTDACTVLEATWGRQYSTCGTFACPFLEIPTEGGVRQIHGTRFQRCSYLLNRGVEDCDYGRAVLAQCAMCQAMDPL